MKTLKAIIAICVMGFMFGCATTNGRQPSNATQGAIGGGIVGGITHAILGGNTKQGLAIVGASTVIGYMLGNEADKSDAYDQQQSYQQQVYQQQSNNPQTKCRKVTRRETINGVTTTTISEECNGKQTGNYY